MTELKKPKFYVDRNGEFGDIKVNTQLQRRDRKGRTYISTEIIHKGNVLLIYDNNSTPSIELLPMGLPEEAEILNEAFIQLDPFRGLFIISQDSKFFIIVDGQKVPLVPGMEIMMNHSYGNYLVAMPWRAS